MRPWVAVAVAVSNKSRLERVNVFGSIFLRKNIHLPAYSKVHASPCSRFPKPRETSLGNVRCSNSEFRRLSFPPVREAQTLMYPIMIAHLKPLTSALVFKGAGFCHSDSFQWTRITFISLSLSLRECASL
mgnify:CR=1 FL=1